MAKKGKARVLDESEFKRLLIIAKDSPFALRNIAIIYCSYGLGLRVKEIAALKITDVYDTQMKVMDEINLKRSMTKGTNNVISMLPIKGCQRSSRIFYDLQNNDQELFNTKGYLFKTQRDNRFQPDVLQKWFRKLYDKAGLIGASSHSGRRTFITRLIEQGADIKAVSRLAGHANIATTSEYVEDNPTRLKRIASLGGF